MAEDTQDTNRIVLLDAPAEEDIASILIYTSNTWGATQAEKYRIYMHETMKELAKNPSLGRTVVERPGVYSHTIKWRRARHGHKTLYQPISNGIYIRRILHTAMNLAEHMGEEEEP